MAKKDKGPGCLMYLFFILFLVCLAGWFLFSNALNFKTLLVYGPSQYAANIWHFHDDYYCQANNPLKIYEDVLPVDSTEKKDGTKPIVTLNPGQKFELKGYRNKAYVQWVAAKVADGPNIVYGYFMIPDKIDIPTFWGAINRIQGILGESSSEPFKNGYFTEITRDATNHYRERVLSDLKTKLAKVADLKKEIDPARMQQIKESKNFKIIDEISSDSAIYYCPKNEYENAMKLYEAYLGEGFDSRYLQTRGNYDLLREGYQKDGFFLGIVDSWYFKITIALILFGLFRGFFRRRKSRKDVLSKRDKEVKSPDVGSQSENQYLTISPKMTVGQFKEHFQSTLGPQVKVYTTVSTKRVADDKAPLSSLKNIKGMYGNVPVDRNFTVSQIEHFFKEMGIGIQILQSNSEKMAPNTAILSEI